MTQDFLRNYKTIFGNLEQDLEVNRLDYRIDGPLAFWDKTDGAETLVLATHGFIKKVDKVPANEIQRAIKIRTKYFENKIEE